MFQHKLKYSLNYMKRNGQKLHLYVYTVINDGPGKHNKRMPA